MKTRIITNHLSFVNESKETKLSSKLDKHIQEFKALEIELKSCKMEELSTCIDKMLKRASKLENKFTDFLSEVDDYTELNKKGSATQKAITKFMKSLSDIDKCIKKIQDQKDENYF